APVSGIDPVSNCPESTLANYGSTVRYTFPLTDGAGRVFNASQPIKDKAGNPAEPVNLTANVDSTPPVISCSVVGTVYNRSYLGSLFGPDAPQGGEDSTPLDLTVHVAVTDAL